MVRTSLLAQPWQFTRRLLRSRRERREQVTIGGTRGWLRSPPKPRAWVVRPWAGTGELVRIDHEEFATLDLELGPRDGSTTNIRRTIASLEWLARRCGRDSGLGLVGHGPFATSSLVAVASSDVAVEGLVVTSDADASRVAWRWPAVATRWIVPTSDPIALEDAHRAIERLGGRHDLLLHELSSPNDLDPLWIDWFEQTLLGGCPARAGWFEELVARRRHHVDRRLVASAQAGALFLSLGSLPASGATITVSVGCTLLDAIGAAETDGPQGGCPAGSGLDTVVLSGNSYGLHSTYGVGLPFVTTPIVIEGNGAVLDGENEVRVVQVAGGTLALNTVTITGGTASAGGGIYAINGGVTLTASTISGNSATRGAGIYARAANAGTVTITVQDSSVKNNTADLGGGGVYSYADGAGVAGVTIESSTVEANSAASAGAIGATTLAGATLTVTVDGGSLVGNTATIDGGAIGASTSGDASSGTLTITDTTIDGNTAGGQGGAIETGALDGATVSVSIAGATVTSNTAGTGGGGLSVESTLGATVTVTVGETVLGSNEASDGGAVDLHSANGATVSVTVQDSSIAGNTATENGAGLHAETLASGTVSITVGGGSLAGNTAGGSGGAVFAFAADAQADGTLVGTTLSGNTATASGGGVYISGMGTAGATVTIDATTIDGNTAGTGGGAVQGAIGGTGTLVAEVRNSTISGNTVTNGDGGGLAVLGSGSGYGVVLMNNAALSGNSASGAGGGIALAGVQSGFAGALLENNIVTNTAGGGDCAVAGGAAFDGFNNLIDDVGPGAPEGQSACAGIATESVTGFDPALRDNGGPTRTHALLPGSNAIDAGVSECGDLEVDQRGVVRPQDGDADTARVCDVGPFEVAETPLFADGFESGDTSGWDGAVGSSPDLDR